MNKKMILKRLIILILLIGLTTSLNSCKTSPEIEVNPEEYVLLNLPKSPALKPVNWIDKKYLGGLLLPYDQYRILENNIIEYRRYIAELEVQVHFYRGDNLGE